MAKRKETAADATALALPGEASVDQVLVDHAVAELNRLYVAKGLETARAVGEYIVEQFFGGDPEAFDKAQKDHESFQALADRDDLQLSKSLLWYSVRLLPQLKLLPQDIATALPMSHHRLLLHVGNENLKRQIARKAVDEGMSKRDLEEEIKKRKKKAGTASKAGRRPLPAFQKTIHGFRSILDRGDDPFKDLDKVDALSTDEAARLYEIVASMKQRCEELGEALKERVGASYTPGSFVPGHRRQEDQAS